MTFPGLVKTMYTELVVQGVLALKELLILSLLREMPSTPKSLYRFLWKLGKQLILSCKQWLAIIGVVEDLIVEEVMVGEDLVVSQVLIPYLLVIKDGDGKDVNGGIYIETADRFTICPVTD